MKFPEYIFDIYGEGPFKSKLEKKYIANSKILNNKVNLKGFFL